MPTAVNFKERICALRPGDQVGGAGDVDLLYAFESDRGRIINSAAIRRLQQRTQVFPLERNAAVRSRLTHSMEVQQTGRFIVRTLYAQLGERAADYGLDGLQGALESLVEMTCLMHDIGNPPFGHFGEFAIGEWFDRALDGLFAVAVGHPQGNHELHARMRADLRNFEGNAQAVRLVVSLQRLRLTYTQTAGLLKYLRPAYEPKPGKGAVGAYLNKKPGFYLSEEGFVAELQQVLGQAPDTRHPVAYIMEAADDISYCLADIEDSVEKGILSVTELAPLLVSTFEKLQSPDTPIPGSQHSFRGLVDQALQRYHQEEINKAGEFFVRLRVSMIHPLVQHAARQFIDNIEAVHAGTLDRALIEDDSLPHAIVQTFKDVAMARVFCHREVETLQLQGHRIIQGLLDSYGALLRVDAQTFVELTEGNCRREAYLQMLVRRLPGQLIKAYRQAVRECDEAERAAWEFYHRCRLIQDFISGMTDQHAHDEYRTLSAL
ncbi:dGTPase [Phytopseudomonas punonensis]|uniref:Probable deoxyguanosinetriphosphate triphosphohydrolase n=1 Tax=Phytopseudomonas punonensis TaxID=1220495 RepID=A0A1M7D887_9GAMM|nr:dGTPase [Pseudomonas punonensis]SHL75660.1 dGTPase [Pseudomonas punonensis]